MENIIAGESRAIRTGTTVAVLLVAIIAAIVSFVHIAHLALTHGQADLAAYLLPVSIDGTVAASSLVMLRAARLDRDTPKLARFMLVLAVLATLAANIEYGISYGAIGALLSGWPAVAFIGSAEMSIGMIRRTREAVATDGAEIEPAALTAPVPGTDTTVTQANAQNVPGTMPYPRPAPVLGTVATPPVPEPVEAVAETVPEVPTPPVHEVPRAVAPKRARSRAPKRVQKSVRERAQDKYGDDIFAGKDVPALRQIMSDLSCGQPKAREALEYLTEQHQYRTAQIIQHANGHARR